MGIAMGLIGAIVLASHGGYSGLLLLEEGPAHGRNDLGTIPLDRLLAAIGATFSMAMAIPVAVAGWAILQLKPWAKTYGLLVTAVYMLLFPIGTVIGVYAMWVLTDEASEFLFLNAPRRRP